MLYTEYFVKFVLILYMLEKQEKYCIKDIYLLSVEQKIIHWRTILLTNNHTVDHFSVIELENLYQNESYRQNSQNLWEKNRNTFKPHGINTKDY